MVNDFICTKDYTITPSADDCREDRADDWAEPTAPASTGSFVRSWLLFRCGTRVFLYVTAYVGNVCMWINVRCARRFLC